MLRTALTAGWGLKYPVLNAPMTPAAGGSLARAVSEAGGLGMIGIDPRAPVEEFHREVATARGADPAIRFGVGLMAWALAGRPELLAAAVAARPFLICISFGDVAPHAKAVRDAGIHLAAQVQDRRTAEAAAAAGVDVLIAQGTEAGGHTGTVGTLPLLQVVLESADRPVLAAGGIASPRGLAAVLAAGAAGALVGTPFLLAAEARVPDEARRRLLDADETQTVLTSLFDRIQQIPWPGRFRGRALANAFTDRWQGREDEAAADPAAARELAEARAGRRYDVAYIYAGQGVGLLHDVLPAAAIVTALGEGAEALLAARHRELFSTRDDVRREPAGPP